MNKDRLPYGHPFGFYIYTMPLMLQKQVDPLTATGVWKIEESADWFRKHLLLDQRENAVIESIRHHQRKLHWLSSRLLLRILLQDPKQFIHLDTDVNGKPFVQNFPVQISISHSAEYSVLLLSYQHPVGIDIEKIDPKIERIHRKFLNPGEINSLQEGPRLEQLFIFWCAKEAMYKWYGRRQLDFRKHMEVEPFIPQARGTIIGCIRKEDVLLRFNIQYERLNGFIMAYVSRPNE